MTDEHKVNVADIEAAAEMVLTRQSAYKRTFGGPSSSHVLEDLADFCHFQTAGFHPDRRMTDVLIGRREVFLRIIQNLELSPDEMFELATGQPKLRLKAVRRAQKEEIES